LNEWNAEERLRAEKPAHHHHARNGREHHRAEDARGPPANHLLDHEEHSGDRRIEGGSEARRRAYRRNQPHVVAGEAQSTAKGRCETRTDLQRRIFGSQRVSRSDRESRGNELADRGPERDVAVEDVERSLGLVHAAAARLRNDMNDEYGDHDTRNSGRGQKPPWRGLRARTEKIDSAPVDRKPKADHRKAREDPNKDGQDKKEADYAKKSLEDRDRRGTGRLSHCGFLHHFLSGRPHAALLDRTS